MHLKDLLKDLCEYCRFEEVAYLILNKDLPNTIQLRKFEKAIPMMMTAAGTIPAAKVLVVGAGILSKLVVFGGRLFANLAGPTLDKDTLVEILATDKEYRSFRRSWRENF